MKLITNIIITISILLSVYYMYLHLVPVDINRISLGVVSLLLLVIPILIEKFSKIKIEKYVKLIYYFFLLISFILGVLFQLYYSTYFFDLIVHGLFGLLLSIIIGTKLKSNSWMNFFLLLSIVIFIGFIWESLEFFSDVFMRTDHQEKISGAKDTMTDLLMSMVGTMIYSVYVLIENKIKNKLHNIIDIS